MGSIEKDKPGTNIIREEKSVLNQLKAKGLVYLPSDKGGEFCVIDSQTYDNVAIADLEDDAIYRIYKKVPRMTAKTIETKINGVWKSITQKEKVKYHITKAYMCHNSYLPRFYHLVKAHREGPTLKIRTIVSKRTGPTRKSPGSFAAC